MRIERPSDANGDDIIARRERVVESVMNRIHAAPASAGGRGMLVELSRLSIPAIAAAAVIIVASLAFTATHDRQTRDPVTIADGLGVPPMLQEKNQ